MEELVSICICYSTAQGTGLILPSLALLPPRVFSSKLVEKCWYKSIELGTAVM